MFEVWAKRKGSSEYEYICGYEDYEKDRNYSVLDILDTGEYEEAIILKDKNYVMMKIYEKGKVLRK